MSWPTHGVSIQENVSLHPDKKSPASFKASDAKLRIIGAFRASNMQDAQGDISNLHICNRMLPKNSDYTGLFLSGTFQVFYLL